MASGETKAERFERIAERRVNEALRTLRLLGNLADRRNYEYTDQHATQLLGRIDEEVRALRARFKTEVGRGAQRFSFRKGG
jgi:hypothetical protein